MFCRHCRTIIPDDSIFCENCGARVRGAEEQQAVALHTSAEIPQPYDGPLQEEAPEVNPPAEDMEEAFFAAFDSAEKAEQTREPEEPEEFSWKTEEEPEPEETKLEEPEEIEETSAGEAPAHEEFDWGLKEEPEAEEAEVPEEPAESAEPEEPEETEEPEEFSWKTEEEPEPEEAEEPEGPEEPEEPEAPAERPAPQHEEFDWRLEEEAAEEETPEYQASEAVSDSITDDPIWWEPSMKPAPEEAEPEKTAPDLAEPAAEEEPKAEAAAEDALSPEEMETDLEEGLDHAMSSAVEAIADKGEAAIEKLRTGIHELGGQAKEADLGGQAKQYLDKAKGWLGSLGKTVRTGTGWAVDAVKEQAENLQSPGKGGESKPEYEEDVEQTPGFWYRKKGEPETEKTEEPEDAAKSEDAAEPENIAGTLRTAEASEPFETSEEPEESETPVAAEEPEVPAFAEEPEEPAAPEEPEIPAAPEEPEEPESGEIPEEPETPEAPEEFVIPEGFEKTDESWGFEEPAVLEETEPETPEESGEPEEITEQEAPGEWDDSEASQEPEEPEEPEEEHAASNWKKSFLNRIWPGKSLDESEEESALLEDEEAEAGEESEAAEEPEAGEVRETAEAESADALAEEAENTAESDAELTTVLSHGEEFDSGDKYGYEEEAVQKSGPLASLSTKMKIGIIAAIVLVIVILAIAISYGTKVHKEREAIEKYNSSVTRAETLIETREYSSAENLYLKMIKFDPSRIEAYEGLAQLYVSQGRYEEATSIIEQGSAKAGDSKILADLTAEIAVLTDTTWKDAYLSVLAEYKREIKQYEKDVSASTAYCDVNGDRKPELFFFTKEYYGYGKLRIYTMVDGAAKEVIYDCRNRGTQYQDSFYDIRNSDSSYAIFKTKGENSFAIYANVPHGSSWSTINEYTLNLQGGCTQKNVVEASIRPTYRENEKDRSEYLRNEQKITYDEYNQEFQRILDSFDKAILYDKQGGDQAVWDKISPENVMCLPYDAMIRDLEKR